MAHSASPLAVDADNQACAGLVGGTVWNRTGFVSTPEYKRPLTLQLSRRSVEMAEQNHLRPRAAAQAYRDA